MSNYPEGFDSSLTLPAAYSDDVVFVVKYICEVESKSFDFLKDPATNGPFFLTPNKTTSFRVSCTIVQQDDPNIMGHLVSYIGTFCSISGEVSVIFNQTQSIYNPSSFYSISVEGTSNSALKIKIHNNSLRRIKAAAVIEYLNVQL
jgi:hypothetical protein